jgi:hypothetical protein
VKQIRKRITYANVMSSIAVFLVLGGGAAYAAKKIGSNEIKGNSITTGKIKKEAVSASKLKKNSVTTPKIANGAVTGAKLNLGTVGTVPNATHAINADNASAINGLHLAKLSFVAGAGTGNTTIFSANGLTLNASCDASEELNLTATTSVNDSEIYESGNFASTFDGGLDDNFDVGDTEQVGAEIGDGTQQEVQGQLVYSTPGSAVVTASFSLNDNEQAHGGTQICAVEGIVQF